MYIKKLKISKDSEIIREINFKNGLNLIVDNTPIGNQKLTGNNVGKTTVLKLIYFCLGGKDSEIYTDKENSKSVYNDIKNFLVDNNVLITLILVEDLDDEQSKKIVIERNFLSGSKAIRKINGNQIIKKDFERELSKLIFPNHSVEKPSFKQLISHNIRYKDDSIENTIKTLNKYSTEIEYEALYLYLLGCSFDKGAEKQAISSKINQEKLYKERLEKTRNKNSYEVMLSIIESEILELNKKKSLLNLNENFELDLKNLNKIKYKINKHSSVVTKLEIRRDIILEAQSEMKKNISKIDLNQLKNLYAEAKEYVSKIHKTFEELVAYHNNMIIEKINFITKELPSLIEKINAEKNMIKILLEEERVLSKKISKSDSFEDLENIISSINDKYRLKGEYESIISQINEVDNNINNLEDELKDINQYLYSDKFQENLKIQINKFNRYFSEISNELYGEKYGLSFEKSRNKKTNKPVYIFSAFNLNMSSGKKQGEILCFDLAYIKFANDENIPCLKFLLNDKKELMHDNQLINVSNFVEKEKIQLIVSILKDKLPVDIFNKSNVAIELSQEEKLFKIK